MSLGAPAGLAQKGSAPADHKPRQTAEPGDKSASEGIDIEMLFEEVYAMYPVAGGGELVSRLLEHAGSQTRRLEQARSSLVAAEGAHDAAQAAVGAVRAATRPLDGSKSMRCSEFRATYGAVRRMLGRHSSEAGGVLWNSRDWDQVQRTAERLIAAAVGLEVAAEAQPAEDLDRLNGARCGVWVSAEAIYEAPGEAVQQGPNGEVAMLAWVQMWAREDVESFEVAAGVVEVAASGALRWYEPLRWTHEGIGWMTRHGIDAEGLVDHQLPEAESGLEL